MATDLQNMTPQEARVAVAKDVLKWIDAGKISGRGITYLCADEPIGGTGLLRDDLARTKTCRVCALGALFYSQVMRFDGLMSEDIDGEVRKEGVVGADVIREKLREVFDENQVILIEEAFEGCIEWHDEIPSIGEGRTERLRLVAQNIIDNNGTFIP